MNNKTAKHARDECMRCSKEPEKEIMWAGHRARGWFCKEHAEEFKKEKDEVTKERDVPNGVVAEEWGDGPVENDDAAKEAFRIGFEKEANTLPGAAAAGALPFGDLVYQGSGEHPVGDTALAALAGLASAGYTAYRNPSAIKNIMRQAGGAAKRIRKVLADEGITGLKRLLDQAKSGKERQQIIDIAKDFFIGGIPIGAAEGAGIEMVNRARRGEDPVQPKDNVLKGLVG